MMSVLRIARVVVSVLAVLATASGAALGQSRRVDAQLTPLVESDAPAGGRVRVALQVTVPKNFHLQSNAPRNPQLIATVLAFETPDGIHASEVVFPKPTDFVVAGIGEPLAVFEHEFVIGVTFDVDRDVAEGAVQVPGRLRYQACDDKLCYAPLTAAVDLTLNVTKQRPAARRYADVFATIPFGTGTPPPPADSVPAPRTLRLPPRAASSDALNDFTLVSSTGGYLTTSEFLSFVSNAERGVKEKGFFEGRGPLAIIFLVLIGGLALNLTPCVLPMIPINLAIIGAGSRAGSPSRGFLLGGVYGAAMALVYGVLGLVVVLTTSTFGTINSSPWFNAAIAIVFVALALAMFDVFSIDFSGLTSKVGSSGDRGSLALAFGMGAVAALLAGACVAPVVIQVVVFSSDLYAKGTVIALGLPFILGLGMAIPWPLAGAGLTTLPRPGKWMVRVKQLFGLVILLTAAYYGYLAYTLFADRWVDAGAVKSSVEAMVKEGWHPSLEEGLAVARREQKPVLVDMWATWCKNCLTMDQTTLATPEVKAALDGYVKVKFQAEQPDESPAREVMERFKAVGLPTYVILRPASGATE